MRRRFSRPSVRTVAALGALRLTMGLTLVLSVVGCGGAPQRPQLPPPVYEQPTLPDWKPPQAAEPEEHIDDSSGGDWADEPPPGEAGPPGAQPPAPAPQEAAPQDTPAPTPSPAPSAPAPAPPAAAPLAPSAAPAGTR
jgi:hypothetical protein